MSVTDAVLVRNWQHFLGIWKTTFAVQNTTFERTFINVIGCTINIGKQVWSQKCFSHSILLTKTNIFDQVFVQNLCRKQKKIITQKWLLKLKSWRKLNQSKIKFYNMWPFKSQIWTYFERKITKFEFSSLSAFSNYCPYAICMQHLL